MTMHVSTIWVNATPTFLRATAQFLHLAIFQIQVVCYENNFDVLNVIVV